MLKSHTIKADWLFIRLAILRWQIKMQEQNIEKQLPIVIETLIPGPVTNLSKSDFKRIIKYWQVGLNVICNGLYRLDNQRLSHKERQRILLLSIFSPLYDDLFDDKILSYDQIEAFTKFPEKYIPRGFKDRLLKKTYLQLLEITSQRENVMEQLYQVFIWQKASVKQLSPDISEAELYEVTYNKSYHSILLFCSLLDHPPSPGMLEMLYPIAGLLQLTNDAFDVYKDIQNGVYTLPNLYLNFDQLLQHFMEEIARFNYSLMQLPSVRRQKKIYGMTIHALNAMGRMALEQLRETTHGITNAKDLATMTRKALVCDLDSMRQRKRWVKQVQYLLNYPAIENPSKWRAEASGLLT